MAGTTEVGVRVMLFKPSGAFFGYETLRFGMPTELIEGDSPHSGERFLEARRRAKEAYRKAHPYEDSDLTAVLVDDAILGFPVMIPAPDPMAV